MSIKRKKKKKVELFAAVRGETAANNAHLFAAVLPLTAANNPPYLLRFLPMTAANNSLICCGFERSI